MGENIAHLESDAIIDHSAEYTTVRVGHACARRIEGEGKLVASKRREMEEGARLEGSGGKGGRESGRGCGTHPEV